MAAISKADLTAAIDSAITTNGTGNITGAQLRDILDNVVESYEDFIGVYTSTERNALTPSANDKIFNSTTKRVEIYSGTEWMPCSQRQNFSVDCSGTPNYPEGLKGDMFRVSVAGKIGGAGGKTVSVNDLVICIVANAGGDEAAEGSKWVINTSAGTAFNDILEATVNLSNANLLALNGTPILGIAAPGAGKVIMPINYVTQYTKNAVDFADGAGPIVAIFDTAPAYISTVCPDLATIKSSAISQSNNINNNFALSIANKALYIKSMSGNYTVGDGTVSIKIYYKIHTL